MLIIVSGAIGRSYVGGQAWAYMHYLAGLRALGHQVYYLEDCGEESWVYNWEEQRLTTDLDYPAAYVQACLRLIGLEHNWIYRAGAASRGISLRRLRSLCRQADLLLVRAVPLPLWRDEYNLPRRRAFIDVDPGFTQIKLLDGDQPLSDTVSHCERLFTFSPLIGQPGCLIPDAGRNWLKTLPPVYLPCWPPSSLQATHFTSVIRWRGFHDAQYNGVRYGQRDQEFPRFLDLPRLTHQPFLIAVLGADLESLEAHGWDAVPGEAESLTPAQYQAFISRSRAEFGVAKHLYVEMRTGWFSDRSACYLASGRPVLLQNTGIDAWLPVGDGIVTFNSLDEANAGIDHINLDYERHRTAARDIAQQFFSTGAVLPPLLEAATL
jgi:hypothetical protein